MESSRKSYSRSRRYWIMDRHTLFAFLVSMLILMAPVFAQSTRLSQTVLIHVSDFGINQPWNSNMQVGDPFQPGQNNLYLLRDKRSQILLPMPSDERMAISAAELSQVIGNPLLQDIDRKLGQHVSEFEIQILQHVNSLGYVDPARQGEVKRFGEAAYAAFGELVHHLQVEGYRVTIDVTAGSNGTVALAAGAQNLATYKASVSHVDLVDGRASLVAIANAIALIGPDKVRIINTHGDFSAPPWSIGNYDAACSLKEQFPELTSLLLTPKSRGLAHIQWMLNPNGAFDIAETVVDTNGTRKVSLGTFSPAQFRNPTTVRTAYDRALKTQQTVSSETALADRLDRLAGNIETLKEFVQALEKIAGKGGLLPPTFSLLPATFRDEADKIRYGGDRTWLASHEIDSMASECLNRLEDIVNKLIESGDLPSSYVFLSRIDGATVADVARTVGEGHLDTASLTALLDDLSKYTAAVAVRLLLSPLGPQVSTWAADATESFIEISSPVFRTMSATLFQNVYRNPVRNAMIDQWITAQNRRMANGQRVESLRQMFGAQLLAEAGFSLDFLDQNGSDTTWFNSVIGSVAADASLGKWSLVLYPNDPRPISLWSDSTPSSDSSDIATTLPAIGPDANDCKAPNCVPSSPKKTPDSQIPCPPLSPGCACPPGSPGCGASMSAGMPPSECPPGDPNCTSRASHSDGAASCPPKCDDPPPTAMAALLKANWRLLASIIGADDRSVSDPIARRLLAHALITLNRTAEGYALLTSSDSAPDLEAYYSFAARLVGNHPDNWTAQFIYGDALARRGEFSSAQRAFTEAMNLQPSAELPVYARGVTRSISSDEDGALLDLTRATEISPALADGWLAQAILWLQLDATDGAQEALSKATRLAQDSALIHLAHGILLFDSGDSQAAVGEIRRAGELSPALKSGVARDIDIVTRQTVSSATPVFPRPTTVAPPSGSSSTPTTVARGVSTKEISNARVDRGESHWIIPNPLGYPERAEAR
jgi:tetratricopeptide (TPR) repeat protein